MHLCKTDTETLLRLLDRGAALIDLHCTRAADRDVVRRLRQMRKRLLRKTADRTTPAKPAPTTAAPPPTTRQASADAGG